jgi:NDP-sugar pyrophosphorylase family protein
MALILYLLAFLLINVKDLNSNNLLVFAGGFGTRLRSAVSDVPKPMAPVGDCPFLHYQIKNWIRQGVKSFIFLLHYEADTIIDYLTSERQGLFKSCDLEWLVEPEPLGTAVQ